MCQIACHKEYYTQIAKILDGRGCAEGGKRNDYECLPTLRTSGEHASQVPRSLAYEAIGIHSADFRPRTLAGVKCNPGQ